MSSKNLLVIVLAVALLAAGCGGEEGDKAQQGGVAQEGGTITVGGEKANNHGTKDVSGETSVEFELDDFYFEPTILEGAPGRAVTLEAFNEGDSSHTFTLEEQNVDEQLQPGDELEIQVTFPDSGTIVFICRFHAGQGMRGALQPA